MSDKDRPNLLAMLEAISQIQLYTAEIANADQFFENRIVFDATLMNFLFLGEMSIRISEVVKLQHPDVQWARIKGFRNLIAHEYLGIDAEEVWQIVQDDIPELGRSIQHILDIQPSS